MGVPYIMAVRMIPSMRYGVYMGIINMMIVIPMLFQSLSFGWIYTNLLGDNPSNAIRFAGVLLGVAGLVLSRRDEAKNVTTIGGDTRSGQVLGRTAASTAIADAVAVAKEEGAAISAALMLEGDAAKALLVTATERSADLVVLGAVQDRSLADRLLGTVALEVAKRVGCDVLIVRPEHGEVEFEVPEDA